MKKYSFHQRPAKRDDAGAMKRLDELCFPEPVQYGKIEFLYLLMRPDVISYVLETNNEMLGFIMTSMEVTKRTANIITIDIHPDYRRRGYASRLLETVENKLSTQNLTLITLQVGINNRPALKFYQKHGYMIQETISDYYPDEDAYFMAKAL